MYKTTIEYEDYNGVQRKEEFYFNLSKAELMEMDLSTQAGIEEKFRMIIQTKDNAEIVKTFKDLILRSHGIKSEDGTRFIKTDALRENFEQSAAYSEYFMRLLSDPDEQQRFMNGVISGANVPNMNEKEAIEKLKELGYDTSQIESAMNARQDNVVNIEDKKSETNV